MFTRDTIKFLKDLEGNKNKTWFDENKSRFQASVQEPALSFVREMKAYSTTAPLCRFLAPALGLKF